MNKRMLTAVMIAAGVPIARPPLESRIVVCDPPAAVPLPDADREALAKAQAKRERKAALRAAR